LRGKRGNFPWGSYPIQIRKEERNLQFSFVGKEKTQWKVASPEEKPQKKISHGDRKKNYYKDKKRGSITKLGSGVRGPPYGGRINKEGISKKKHKKTEESKVVNLP